MGHNRYGNYWMMYLKRLGFQLVCVLMVFMLGTLAGCQSQSASVTLYGTDITGADFAKSFKLTDHSGKVRTLADFKGQVVLLFFGYTHCPDICPTTMADLAKAMKLLGEDSRRVQVLFVTVDPERDTQQLLAQYVPSFYPSFLGLYGTLDEIAATASDYKIYYSKQASDGQAKYTIDHSAGVYAYDPDGRIRIYLKYGQKPEQIASDLKTLL